MNAFSVSYGYGLARADEVLSDAQIRRQLDTNRTATASCAKQTTEAGGLRAASAASGTRKRSPSAESRPWLAPCSKNSRRRLGYGS